MSPRQHGFLRECEAEVLGTVLRYALHTNMKKLVCDYTNQSVFKI